MTSYTVTVTGRGTTRSGSSSTPTPIGVASNPNRSVDVDTPVIVTTTLQSGELSAAYSAQLNVVGGVLAYTWTVASGSLPTGITLSTAGLLSGTPTVFGDYSFTVQVVDALGRSDTQNLTLTVVTGPQQPDYGPHIGDWMVQAGDQKLVVPDGSYDGGHINQVASVHAATAGTYGGWLILEAETEGGVTVDLSTTGFNLGAENGTNRVFRIMFVGFNFVNGDVDLWNSNNVRFWRCTSTFPIAVWLSQYTAAGGSPPAYNASIINSMVNPNCRGINTVGQIGVGSPYNNYIGIYGHVFDNHGNDAIYSQGTNNLAIVGCKFRKVYHYAQSPTGPTGGGSKMFHSDCIQIEWGSNITITDNFIGGHIQMDAHDSGITNVTVNNNWQAGSEDTGWILDKETHAFTNCALSNHRWWGNGQYQNGSGGYTATPTYDSGYDLGVYNANSAYPGTTTQAGWTYATVTHAAPSGVTITSGLITDLPDQTSAWNHASNPANVWRAAHSYSSWESFFSGNWP